MKALNIFGLEHEIVLLEERRRSVVAVFSDSDSSETERSDAEETLAALTLQIREKQNEIGELRKGSEGEPYRTATAQKNHG